jgi:hypothetical protein
MQRMLARLPRVHVGEDMSPETAAKMIKRIARTVSSPPVPRAAAPAHLQLEVKHVA